MTSIIKVDTIQTTSGNTVVSTDSNTVTIKDASGTNTAMTINSDGVVSTSARPAFSAYRDSTTTEGLTGTVIFNGVYSNVGSHYNTSTGIFTAPVSGLYQFNFVGFGSNDTSGNYLAAGSSVMVSLMTSSTVFARTYTAAASSAIFPNMSFSAAIPLNANDEIYISVGSSYVYSDASDAYLRFSGYLVG